MLPDDDKRYAIETCRSSESVLKSDLKINDIISAYVCCVIISRKTIVLCDRLNSPTCDLLTQTETLHLKKHGMRLSGVGPLKIKSCLPVPVEGTEFYPKTVHVGF